MASTMSKRQRRDQQRQELQATIDGIEGQRETLIDRALARHLAAEVEDRDFTLPDHAEADRDATDWFCLGMRRDVLRMELMGR